VIAMVIKRDVRFDYLEANHITISHIDCYLIQTAESDKLDATVIAPVIRRFPHIVNLYGLGQREPVTIASGGGSHQELLEEIKDINTITEFEAKFEHLFSEIVTKMLGKCEDFAIREEILKLQCRLMNEMKSNRVDFPISDLKSAFERGEMSEIIHLTGMIHSQFIERWTEPTWPPKLFHLLRMCTGNLGSVYSLSALGSRFQSNRVRPADVIENFELLSVQVLEGSDALIMCPISYKEASDIVLLVKKPSQGLLAGEASELANVVITNSLSALRYPDFCKKILNHIDHPIALRSMKEAKEAGYPIKQSPLTRAPIIGGLFLGAGKEHSHATDFVITQLMTEGKRAGNSDLWFMLIWWLLEQNKIPYLMSILPQVREYLKFRLRNHLGTFTMTNTPYMPITLIPMGIAAWSTIATKAIGATDEQATLYLKCHLGHVDVLEAAVNLMQYPLPPIATHFLTAWHTLAHLRKIIIDKDVDFISWAIQSCHNVLRIDRNHIENAEMRFVSDVVALDGEASEDQIAEAERHLPSWFVELTPKMRRAAVRMLEFFDISSLVRTDLDLDIASIGWQYEMREYEIPKVSICPATCRPFYFDLSDHQEWFKHSQHIFGNVEHQIHIHKYFIEYVNKYRKYPTRDEFLMFIFLDIAPRHKATLPLLVDKFVNEVFDGYRDIITTIDPVEFNSRTTRSLRLQYREKIESRYRRQQSGMSETESDAGGDVVADADANADADADLNPDSTGEGGGDGSGEGELEIEMKSR
jgi:hypothetical protein